MRQANRTGLPHHDPSARYVSNPTPSLGETVTITLELGDQDVTSAWLRSVRDGEQGWSEGVRDGRHFHFELGCHQRSANYRFHLETADGARWLNGTGLHDWDPSDNDDFRLITTGAPPAWIGDTVWYQIFPDRFASSGQHTSAGDAPGNDWINWSKWDDPIAEGPAAMTQLYGGDLDGIIERLPHLAELGVGGIYLNPVFPARSNHRYDATTFDHVDPLLGGDEALARLSAAADELGIRVMTDLTLNHTGDGHEWFQAAQADPDSVEAGFYYFIEHPDAYESWLGISSLPKLDHASAELRRRYYEGDDSIVARYLKPPFNMAGWRIDVANMTGRLGHVDLNQDVAKATRATVDDIDPQRWLVGEHFFDASRDAPGDGWHGVMNYSGITRPIASWLGEFTALGAFVPGPEQASRNGVQMARSMDGVRAAMPWQVTIASMNLLSSHDTARWRTMAASDEIARVGFGLLLTLPGAPTFLYGDEVGLTGSSSEEARRTMPWDSDSWDQGFLDWYRSIISLRNEHEALRSGGFRWVDVADDAIVFTRHSPGQRLLIRASRADSEPVTVSLDSLEAATATPIFSSGAAVAGSSDAALVLPQSGPGFDVWSLD